MATWVYSSVVRAADCRSAGPWLKSGYALAPLPGHPFCLLLEALLAQRFACLFVDFVYTPRQDSRPNWTVLLEGNLCNFGLVMECVGIAYVQLCMWMVLPNQTDGLHAIHHVSGD